MKETTDSKKIKRICLKAISDIKWFLCESKSINRIGLDNRTAVVLFAKLLYNVNLSDSITKSEYNNFVIEKVMNGDIERFNKMVRMSPCRKKKEYYKTINSFPKLTKPQKPNKKTRSVKKSNKAKYREFLHGDYWKSVKVVILARDNNKCTKCGSTKYLNIHHLTYKNHTKEHEHPEDLITLCRDCHKEVHGLA